MPELPDVEGFRRIAGRMAGRRIDRTEVLDAGVLRDVGTGRLRRQLSGRVIAAPRRHGKWLIAPLRSGKRHQPDEPTLLLHFGMTGGLVWESAEQPRHRHDRLVLRSGNRELRYRDMRKLQGVRLAGDDEDVDSTLEELGPDAATVSAEQLRTALEKSNRGLKSALMSQELVAGLGNLLADEILWRARLHPSTPTGELAGSEHRRLYGRLRTVLRESMNHGRIPTGRRWLTGCRDEDSPTCPRCGTRLRKDRTSGRSTVWCPYCQKPSGD